MEVDVNVQGWSLIGRSDFVFGKSPGSLYIYTELFLVGPVRVVSKMVWQPPDPWNLSSASPEASFKNYEKTGRRRFNITDRIRHLQK